MGRKSLTYYFTRHVVVIISVILLDSVGAQVIVRTSKGVPKNTLNVASWPPALAFAWDKVALLESTDAQQVSEIRERVIQGLIGIGKLNQAAIASNRLSGVGRYEAFAKVALASEGEMRALMRTEAERGFDLLSQRNQEQLASELVPIVITGGWDALYQLIARCLDVEARLLALGRAAAVAAPESQEIFDRCISMIEETIDSLNLLGRRYAALAMTEVAQSLVGMSKVKDGWYGERWTEVAQAAADYATGVPNAETIYAELASVFLNGGQQEQAGVLFEKAIGPFRQLGQGTPERMNLMLAITTVSKEFGEGRLPKGWAEQVLEEAKLADVEWKWEVMINAGRILIALDKGDWALECWQAASLIASEDPNPVVHLVCLAMLALEARDAGMEGALDWLHGKEGLGKGTAESIEEEPTR